MACKENKTKSEVQPPLKKSNETELPLEKDSETEQSQEQNNEAEQSFESGETIEKTGERRSAVECKKTFKISENEFISMQVLPKKISINSQAYLTMENHSKGDMFYSNPFSLEYFNESDWVVIQWDAVSLDVGFVLSAGETITLEPMNLYPLIENYNEGKKGRYRIIKRLGNYNLCDEFEIE